MTPDQWFVVASQAAAAGWILLAVGLFLPRPWAGPVLFFGGRVLPLALCVAYLLAILRWWGGHAGGFGSLEALALLFASKGLLLAGWVHYLAFDLLLGRWQVDRVRAMPGPDALRWLALPCLATTLMFGPAGLLLFLLLSRIGGQKAPNRETVP